MFADIKDDLFEFINGSELIIHNAPFDVGFIEHEYKLANHIIKLAENCNIFDTLVYARKLHPGQKNSLDALCKIGTMLIILQEIFMEHYLMQEF